MIKGYKVHKNMVRSGRELVLVVNWYSEIPEDEDDERDYQLLIDQIPTGCHRRDQVTPELVDELVAERMALRNEEYEAAADLTVPAQVRQRHSGRTRDARPVMEKYERKRAERVERRLRQDG